MNIIGSDPILVSPHCTPMSVALILAFSLSTFLRTNSQRQTDSRYAQVSTNGSVPLRVLRLFLCHQLAPVSSGMAAGIESRHPSTRYIGDAVLVPLMWRNSLAFTIAGDDDEHPSGVGGRTQRLT